MNREETTALAVVGGIAAFIITKVLVYTTINRVVGALADIPANQK